MYINPEEYMVNIYHFLNATKTLNSFKLKQIAWKEQIVTAIIIEFLYS